MRDGGGGGGGARGFVVIGGVGVAASVTLTAAVSGWPSVWCRSRPAEQVGVFVKVELDAAPACRARGGCPRRQSSRPGFTFTRWENGSIKVDRGRYERDRGRLDAVRVRLEERQRTEPSRGEARCQGGQGKLNVTVAVAREPADDGEQGRQVLAVDVTSTQLRLRHRRGRGRQLGARVREAEGMPGLIDYSRIIGKARRVAMARPLDEGVGVESTEVPRRPAPARTPPDGRSRPGHVGAQHILLLCLVAHNVPADRDAHRDGSPA